MTKDEIIEYLYENHTHADIKVEEMAEDLAEPEIIRCKDCKHRYMEDMIWHCPFGLMGGENFFCGYGCQSRGREKRMRLIDADALYERTAEWEAQALHMCDVTMNDEDKTEWRKWSAVLAERSAFKYDIADAPIIEPEQHWIPVTERLPKKHGESYIVTISDGSVYSAALQWDANCKRWYLSFLNDGNILVDFIDDVIAWMPLPEPWKGEEK